MQTAKGPMGQELALVEVPQSRRRRLWLSNEMRLAQRIRASPQRLLPSLEQPGWPVRPGTSRSTPWPLY